jgi:hypothetical protein
MRKFAERIEDNIVKTRLNEGETVIMKSKGRFLVPRTAALLWALIIVFLSALCIRELINPSGYTALGDYGAFLDDLLWEIFGFDINFYSLFLNFAPVLLIISVLVLQRLFRIIILTNMAVLVYTPMAWKVNKIYFDNIKQVDIIQGKLGKLLGYGAIKILNGKKEVIQYVKDPSDIHRAIKEQSKIFLETQKGDAQANKKDILIVCPFCKAKMRLETSISEFKKIKCGRCNKTITTKNVIFEKE